MSEHEKMLIKTIRILESEGFRVIRLDRRIIPDAIAIKGKKVTAIEVSTSQTSVSITKRKISGSQYDSELIVTRPYNQHYHKPEVYFRVLELAKQNKYSYRTIRAMVMKEFNLASLGITTIHEWIKGKKKPLTLLNLTPRPYLKS